MLKNNQGKYSGKWVALIGDQAIGIEDDLKVLLEKVQKRRTPEDMPLIHRSG
jgi:hypothetical protein